MSFEMSLRGRKRGRDAAIPARPLVPAAPRPGSRRGKRMRPSLVSIPDGQPISSTAPARSVLRGSTRATIPASSVNNPHTIVGPSEEVAPNTYGESEENVRVAELSERRQLIRKEMMTIIAMTKEELEESASNQFVNVLIAKLDILNEKSKTLTTEISILLDLSAAKVDCIVQQDYDKEIIEIKAKAKSEKLNERNVDKETVEKTGENSTAFLQNPTNSTTETLNASNTSIAPDDWIDSYIQGFTHPVALPRPKGSVRQNLKEYDGSPTLWFKWIGLFRALVHDSPSTPDEKLAILENTLTGSCSQLLDGLGGGEEAYKEALRSLKDFCGDREIMRSSHLTAIRSFNPGRTSADLAIYAQNIRPHLFELDRIDNMPNPDLINNISIRLHPSIQKKVSKLKSQHPKGIHLKDFGSWLYNTAKSYVNPYQAVKDQPANKAVTRTYQTSSHPYENSEQSKKCFLCLKYDHYLSKCPEFLEKNIHQRINFLNDSQICTNCFRKGHRYTNCRFDSFCKTKDCQEKHNYTLHRAAETTSYDMNSNSKHD